MGVGAECRLCQEVKVYFPEQERKFRGCQKSTRPPGARVPWAAQGLDRVSALFETHALSRANRLDTPGVEMLVLALFTDEGK